MGSMIIFPKEKLSDLAGTCIVYDVFENLTSPVDCTNVFALVSAPRLRTALVPLVP